MKYVLFSLLMVSSIAMAAPAAKTKTLPISKDMVKNDKTVKTSDKKEEDCDDKAKKKIEIKEESISILGGNTGCSLDEMN